MPDMSPALREQQRSMFIICDRCARRSPSLLFDDISLQELCGDCFDHLKRRRWMIPQFTKHTK